MQKDKVLVNTKFLANMYNVTAETIRLWRNIGLPYYQYGPKTLRYDVDKVSEWMEQKYKKQEVD